MRAIHSISRKLFVLFAVLSSEKLAGCNPITNSDLNDRIREFSSKNDGINSTGIKTLQKEESERNTNLSPARSPILFKDVQDSALSSSYSRGLLHHEHAGYTLHDYEESPIYGHEYHSFGPSSLHHGYDHHSPDHYHGHHGGHHDINYHHKHYDHHALAAKTFLWPIAGIALLGAAAALVSNPVLLQLGVVSGRRKRRDTEETFDTEVDGDLSWLKKNSERVNEDSKLPTSNKRSGKKQSDAKTFLPKSESHDDALEHRVPTEKYSVKQKALFKKLEVQPTVQLPVEIAVDNPRRFFINRDNKDSKLIPVPLVLKEND